MKPSLTCTLSELARDAQNHFRVNISQQPVSNILSDLNISIQLELYDSANVEAIWLGLFSFQNSPGMELALLLLAFTMGSRTADKFVDFLECIGRAIQDSKQQQFNQDAIVPKYSIMYG
jgi:hypothetical protein